MHDNSTIATFLHGLALTVQTLHKPTIHLLISKTPKRAVNNSPQRKGTTACHDHQHAHNRAPTSAAKPRIPSCLTPTTGNPSHPRGTQPRQRKLHGATLHNGSTLPSGAKQCHNNAAAALLTHDSHAVSRITAESGKCRRGWSGESTVSRGACRLALLRGVKTGGMIQ